MPGSVHSIGVEAQIKGSASTSSGRITIDRKDSIPMFRPHRLIRFSRRRDERGMSTAEYAVGTIGACSVGGLLVQIAQSDWFGDFMKNFFDKIPSILPF